mgnify:CR=1 FL=1
MLKLIFALIAVAVAVPAGGLLAGVDRRLTARLQSRQGPPLLQPFYDVLKLFGKAPCVTNPWLIFSSYVCLMASAIALLMFFMQGDMLLLFLGFGLIPTAVAYILYMQGLSMGLETSKVPVVMSFETVVTVLVGIGVYAESAGAIKVLGIVLVLMSILIMNTDFSKLRNSVFVGHVAESMTFKPNAWWTEKTQDMDLFKERTGIALEPTVQESPWYFVR